VIVNLVNVNPVIVNSGIINLGIINEDLHKTVMAKIKAKITDICTQTPSVKTFVLDYGSQHFNYTPGQWVDIHIRIDNEPHNGGYSITSIPHKKNAIEVAIKYAPNFPLTTYLHNQSKIGDQVYLSNGQGDIVLAKQITAPLVFIAGGVGISPLISMLRHAASTNTTVPVILLYSITRPEEFLFSEALQNIKQTLANFQYFVTVTQNIPHPFHFNGRINQQMITAVKPPTNASYYLCGPPKMVTDVEKILIKLQTSLGVDPACVHYDKWW